MSKSKQQAAVADKAGPKAVTGKRAGQGRDVAQPVFHPDAAGIDIGAREICTAVPGDRDPHPVRKCDTFTSDLHQMAEWLVSCGITTVAMESTGVYWIPVYDVLEQHGIQPCLVNPRNMKNVPGKRTDFHECQWIQYLHSMGLLHSAFRPDHEVCAVQHLQKALTQMNVQIQHVISDLTGLTGLAILDAIVEGERDPRAEFLSSFGDDEGIYNLQSPQSRNHGGFAFGKCPKHGVGIRVTLISEAPSGADRVIENEHCARESAFC